MPRCSTEPSEGPLNGRNLLVKAVMVSHAGQPKWEVETEGQGINRSALAAGDHVSISFLIFLVLFLNVVNLCVRLSVCVCHQECTDAFGQKWVLNSPQDWSYWWLWAWRPRCWKLNSGPVKEQQDPFNYLVTSLPPFCFLLFFLVNEKKRKT